MFQALTDINCLFPTLILLTGFLAVRSWASRPTDRESRRTYNASMGLHWGFSGPICLFFVIAYVYLLLDGVKTPSTTPDTNTPQPTAVAPDATPTEEAAPPVIMPPPQNEPQDNGGSIIKPAP